MKILLMAVVLTGMIGCGVAHQPDFKTRVATMPEQVAQAQAEAARQTAIAQQAQEQARQDRQALEQSSNSNRGIQHTNKGIITEVNEVWQNESESSGWYLGFTFQDETGYTKRFYPVCMGQTLHTSSPVVLMYHWHEWESRNYEQIGCYVIDGYQAR